MHGYQIRLPDGSVAFVDGAAPRKPKCSTRGCRKRAANECDFPVQKPQEADPPVYLGEARVHLLHRIVFYVVRLHGDGTLTVSTDPPGSRHFHNIKTVAREEWFAKASTTCDAPMCDACRKRVGRLDFCKLHGDTPWP